MKCNHRWTVHDFDRLRKLCEKGIQFEQACVILGHTKDAARQAIRVAGVKDIWVRVTPHAHWGRYIGASKVQIDGLQYDKLVHVDGHVLHYRKDGLLLQSKLKSKGLCKRLNRERGRQKMTLQEEAIMHADLALKEWGL